MPAENFALCRPREIARDPPYLLRASMASAGAPHLRSLPATKKSLHDRTNLDRANRRPAGTATRVFTLPVTPHCAACAGAVHDHSRLHHHVAARRHPDARTRYYGRPIRRGGFGLRVQRRDFVPPLPPLRPSTRPPAPSPVLLFPVLPC